VNEPPKSSLYKPSALAEAKVHSRVNFLEKYGTDQSMQRFAEFVAKLPNAGESALISSINPSARQCPLP
jgi:hypothetical protein